MAETRSKTKVIVGLFLFLGLVCVSYLAIQLGDVSMFEPDRYRVIARFTSASGLRTGTYVEAGGVRVGIVERIEFEPEDYLAVVTMAVDRGVPIHDDAMASIRTAGIIGEKFIKITPGGSEQYLESGMEIVETEPSISLEELISKYIFESGGK